jgi:hypothetical protein
MWCGRDAEVTRYVYKNWSGVYEYLNFRFRNDLQRDGADLAGLDNVCTPGVGAKAPEKLGGVLLQAAHQSHSRRRSGRSLLHVRHAPCPLQPAAFPSCGIYAIRSLLVRATSLALYS